MTAQNETSGRIRILPPLLAQKIAAGEVIDRPQSVIRELLDNAIDSGASEIDVWLREGGNTSIIVQDNGSGMDRDNLALCWLSHATSKLHEEADLQAIRTMGFRGEALSSIASVARLAIFSAREQGGACLEVQGGSQIRLEAWAGRRGTRVEVHNLFFNLPARLQFLKRAASEFLLCKTTCIEKALAHPGIAFRVFNEDKLVLFLPRQEGEEGLRQRFTEIYAQQINIPGMVHQINANHPEGSITLVIGRPELYQHDRKLIQVYINRRRVNEFSLVQAVEAGFTGFLPGGRFPVAAVFLEIDPSRVDVNIHPAKREVKLMDGRRLHSLVVRMIQDFLRIDFLRRGLKEKPNPIATPELDPWFSAPITTAPPSSVQLSTRQFSPGGHSGSVSAFDRGMAALATDHAESRSTNGIYDLNRQFAPGQIVSETHAPFQKSRADLEYLGQVFGVFLLARHRDELLMLDFHAAHERLLFDRYRSNSAQQSLLVPIRLAVDDPALGKRLESCVTELSRRGIILVHREPDWLLEAIPLSFSGNTDLLVDALESEDLNIEELDRCLFANLACRAARKDGEVFDPGQAMELLIQALALPEPRCPHGRPVWFSLSKDELFELVGRKV